MQIKNEPNLILVILGELFIVLIILGQMSRHHYRYGINASNDNGRFV